MESLNKELADRDLSHKKERDDLHDKVATLEHELSELARWKESVAASEANKADEQKGELEELQTQVNSHTAVLVLARNLVDFASLCSTVELEQITLTIQIHRYIDWYRYNITWAEFATLRWNPVVSQGFSSGERLAGILWYYLELSILDTLF